MYRLPATKDGRPRGILITGGASGIGLNTAVKFLLDGWIVRVYDINISNLQEKICEVEPLLKNVLNDKLVYQAMDVTDVSSCQSGLNHFFRRTEGKLDVLFNCAGISYHGPFETESLARQKKIINVNCEGLMQMTYISLEALKKPRTVVW